jgi:hypothetical protein
VTLQVVYESELLDHTHAFSGLVCWDLHNYHGPSKFWHAYLVYKVRMAEKCSSSDRLHFNLRQIAEYVCKETNADMGETIEKLCWPALNEATGWSSTWSILDNEPLDLKFHLLCAAAYLGLIPLAQRLLREGLSLIDRCRYFSYASPIELAISGGNEYVLQLFQEYLPEVDDPGPDADTDSRNAWLAGRTGTDAVEQAARSGDVNMVRLAIYPPSRATPESTEFMGQQYGSVDQDSEVGFRLRRGQSVTRKVEVYKYLEGFFAEPDKISHMLSEHARWGNIEMVRYLVDLGANIHETDDEDINPFVNACRHCKEDIVTLFLELGADPNYDPSRYKTFCGHLDVFPVIAAAKAGSFSIVRKLLDHGANLGLLYEGHTVGFHALREAVCLEHTDLVELFLQLGVDVTENEGAILKMALQDGLDSMTELLQQAVASVHGSEDVVETQTGNEG